MDYPFMRKRDRGDATGRTEIVFSEGHGYDEAQAFAAALTSELKLVVTNRVDGPDAWIWHVQNEEGTFVIGYDDFPCETTLWAAVPKSDAAVLALFARLTALAEKSMG